MAAPRQPLVTVIMPVYNAGDYLRAAVDSILAQTHGNWELLLIDDGSTDACVSRLDDVTDSRVVRVRQVHAGKSAAMNRGLAMARGEFYALQDADDVSRPQRITRQVAALLARPDVAGVFCGHEVILNGRTLAPVCRAKSVQDCARDIALGWMPAHDPTAMYRLSLVGDLRYEEELPVVEGHDYVLRVGERFPLLVLDECLYGYRVHPLSATRNDPSRRRQFASQVIDRMYARRGLQRPVPRLGPDVPGNRKSDADTELVSHFTASVGDQIMAGRRADALRTGVAGWKLRPMSAYYAKPLAYALVPRALVKLYRAAKQRRDERHLVDLR